MHIIFDTSVITPPKEVHPDRQPPEGPRTPREWVPVVAEIGKYARSILPGRNVTFQLGPQAAWETENAYWIAPENEIRFQSNRVLPGVLPENCEPLKRSWRAMNGAFTGALVHELGHAEYSPWVPQDLIDKMEADGKTPFYTLRERHIIESLDEPRIEYLMLRKRVATPEWAPSLTRMALEVVADDFNLTPPHPVTGEPMEMTRYGVSVAALFTLGRVDAGSLSKEAAKPFREAIREKLDDDVIEELRKVWSKFFAIGIDWTIAKRDLPHEKFRDIAREWIALVVDPENPEENTDDDIAGDSSPGMSIEIQIGEGAPGEGGQPLPDGPFGEMIKAMARQAAAQAELELDKQADEALRAERREDAQAESDRQDRGEKAKSELFPKDPNHIAHGDGGNMPIGQVNYTRQPKTEELSAAVLFADALRRVTASSIEREPVRSSLPPGRLRGRAAVLGSAQLANGQRYTARPFQNVKRTYSETPKIRVGVLTDVSGSMSIAVEPAAVIAYVLARGAQVADAQFAACISGNNAYGTVAPNTEVKQVTVPHANGSTEIVKPSLDALDGALDLLGPDSVRILFILSDAHLGRAAQAEYMTEWLAAAERAGTVVVWVHWDHFKHNHGYGEVLNVGSMTPPQVATAAGRTVIEATRRAVARMG